MDVQLTPSEGKQVAVVLGGTNPHKQLIANLKNRGYYVVLVDYLEFPPAAAAADEHVQVSALDPKAVLAVAKKYKAKVVMSVCLDRTIPVIAEVSALLGLPSVYTPSNALWFTDKAVMKDVFKANGIQVPQDRIAEQVDELDLEELGLPLVLKPSDSTGSLGIEVVNTVEELKPAFERVLQASRSKKVVAEEWLAGREFSIDCVVSGGVCHVILIREKLMKVTSDGGIQCSASLAPAIVSKAEMIAIEDVARSIPAAFHLTNAPLLIQGFVDGERGFKVIEIAVRLGGGPGSFRVATLKTGVDLVNAAVDSQLGNACEVRLNDSGLVYATLNLYAKGGVLDRVEGMEELLQTGIVLEHYPYKPAGTEFSTVTTARNRFAAVVIAAPDHQELHRKVHALYQGLKVFSRSGSDIFDMDLAYSPT